MLHMVHRLKRGLSVVETDCNLSTDSGEQRVVVAGLAESRRNESCDFEA